MFNNQNVYLKSRRARLPYHTGCVVESRARESRVTWVVTRWVVDPIAIPKPKDRDSTSVVDDEARGCGTLPVEVTPGAGLKAGISIEEIDVIPAGLVGRKDSPLLPPGPGWAVVLNRTVWLNKDFELEVALRLGSCYQLRCRRGVGAPLGVLYVARRLEIHRLALCPLPVVPALGVEVEGEHPSDNEGSNCDQEKQSPGGIVSG